MNPIFANIPRNTVTASSGGSAPSGTAAASGGGKAVAARPVALGVDATAAGVGGAAAGGGEGGVNIAALLQNPQTNAAAFLAIVVLMAVLWRLAFMNPLVAQTLRGAHYPSHTLWTALICWVIGLTSYLLLHRPPSPAQAA